MASNDLPKIPDEKRQIKRIESIVAIIFHSIFIVFLTFSSDFFGVWVFNEKFSAVIPFLNEQTYGSSLLLIMLIFGFGILKEGLKLVCGKWIFKLATLILILNVISFIAILFFLNNPNFWNPNFINDLTETGIITVGTDGFYMITNIWERLTFWIFIIFMGGLLWKTVNGFIKVRRK